MTRLISLLGLGACMIAQTCARSEDMANDGSLTKGDYIELATQAYEGEEKQQYIAVFEEAFGDYSPFEDVSRDSLAAPGLIYSTETSPDCMLAKSHHNLLIHPTNSCFIYQKLHFHHHVWMFLGSDTLWVVYKAPFNIFLTF